MTPDNLKIQALLALGKPEHNRDWPDYIKLYDLDAGDVPALLGLYRDDGIHSQGEDEEEATLWAALHAWRALGQLGHEAAIEPLVASFDTLFDDDFALGELSRVMAMLGTSAIEPLQHFWQQPGKNEFAYVMAMDSLYEIASAHPHSRDRVITIYRDYMATPVEAHDCLNGLLMGHLVDLEARELIDDIRTLFARGCVDISCAGDLEEIEILLGFRDQRSTPKPDYSKVHATGAGDAVDAPGPDGDDIYAVIDYWLMRYGHDGSVLDVSEMDGYFAAIACAPELIMASSWIPAIWGGEELAPDWDSENDVNQFCTALLALYNCVVEDLQSDEYSALFLESTVGEPEVFIVDEWCEGFLRGVCLWGSLSAADSAILDTCLKPIRLFTSDHSVDYLMSIDVPRMVELQGQIEPAVKTLYQHFFKTRKKASTPYVHTTPKVGRNAPCPCGSGKKYKKCCGLH